jgi:hypothetical protein
MEVREMNAVRRPAWPRLPRAARRAVGCLAAALLAGCGELPSDPPEAPAPPKAGDVPERTFGTAGPDGAQGVAIHGSGVYVVGHTGGTLDGPHLGSSDAFIRKYHPEGEILWADQFGTHLSDRADAVAADDEGHVYVAGTTSGSLAGSRGSTDAFLRTYSRNGVLRWTRQFGTSTFDRALGVAADHEGNAYVVGETYGSLEGSNSGDYDAFVRKYSPEGEVLWTRQFGTGQEDVADGVAVHPNGAVYVAGYTLGDLQGTSKGDVDAFLRKYSATGNVIWTRQIGTTTSDYAVDVDVDTEGSAYIVGYTFGSFVGGNAGGVDAFIRKYGSAGTKQWTDQFGTMDDEFALAVGVDASGRAHVTGYTGGSLAGPNAGFYDAFVRRYRANGTVAWTEQFGTSLNTLGYGITALTGSEIYVAGSTELALVGASQGGFDAFLRRLTGGGSTVWTDQ